MPRLFDRHAVLFLWATVPMLPEALTVLQAWGFTYKTMLVWRKIGHRGIGYWFLGEAELLLFGVRGHVPAFRSQLPNVIEAPVETHSRKPAVFRERIEQSSANMPDRRSVDTSISGSRLAVRQP